MPGPSSFINEIFSRCFKNFEPHHLDSPSLYSSIKKKREVKEANESSFEVSFYESLMSVKGKYDEFIENKAIGKEEKLALMTTFLEELHVMDKKVREHSKAYQSDVPIAHFEFLEKGWAYRLFQSLIEEVQDLEQLCEAIKKGSASVAAEDLYAKASSLEKAYDQLAGSKYSKSLSAVSALILNLRKYADHQALGEGLSWTISPELQKLPKEKQRELKAHCLTQYKHAVECMESVVAAVGSHYVGVKPLTSKFMDRVCQIIEIHAEIETEKIYEQPNSTLLVAEARHLIASCVGNSIPNYLYAQLSELFLNYFETLTPDQGKKQAIVLFSLISETLTLSSQPNIEFLTQYFDLSIQILNCENKEEIKAYRKEQEKVLKPSHQKELKKKVKVAEVFGKEDMRVAGALGLNPVHFQKLTKEGNLREKLTAIFNAIVPPTLYFSKLLGNKKLVDEINRRLDGFEIDVRLAEKYHKEYGRLFMHKKGLTHATKAKASDPLHKHTRTKAKGRNNGVDGVFARDIPWMPLSEREMRSIARDPLKLGFNFDQELPWLTGNQMWDVQHAPLPRKEGSFAKEALSYYLPMRAGPSGTTDRLFEAGQYLGIFEKDEDYATFRLACISYLITIDAHSFHEVMIGASPYHLPYKPAPDVYSKLMPQDPQFSEKLKAELSSLYPGVRLPKEYLSFEYQKEAAEKLLKLTN